MEEKRIIEINGVKMEIDLRHAKTIENYKVGDSIKVLIKQYDNYKSFIGVIVGFDEFQNNPTIVIAYLEVDYNEANIKFVYFNKTSKDVEICPINKWDLPYSKQSVIDKIDREILKKEQEVETLKSKRQVFLEMFGKYFESQQKGITPNNEQYETFGF